MVEKPYVDFDPTTKFIYVEDCDTIYENALKYGCVALTPLTNRKYTGERYGVVQDEQGDTWWIATRVENLPLEEQRKRLQNKENRRKTLQK